MVDRGQLGTIRPLRRSEYDRLVAHGAFEDERIELLHGALVVMSPQNVRHADVARRLADHLTRTLGERALVSCQFPFAATRDSEPEPDIAVIPRRRYGRGHPRSAFLVVEVAHSSLRKDRLLKADIYASASVPEYWIINLRKGTIEVHTHPAGGRYRRRRLFRHGERIVLAVFPDVGLGVSEVLAVEGRSHKR